MSILSQIIAYSPNKIDTETKVRSLVQGPRNMYNQGQLVSNTVDGSRPGYSGKKYVEVDGTKYRIIQKGPKKNKIAFRGRNLEGIQTYEYFDNKTQIKNRIEKGKKQNIDKQIKLKSESAADVNRVRDNIDNWTKKWVKDNFNKYEIQDNNKFVEDLKKAWSKESKKNIYKLSEDVFKSGFSRWNNNSINVSDFPNFTQVQATSERTPLKIEGIFKTAGNMDTQPSSYDNFFKKTFFANKLNSDKKLKNQFNKVFDFVNKDKSKLSQKNFIKAHGNFLTNIDPDVMYMLSDDALYSTARYDLFSKTFGDSYEKYRENYIKKTNNYFKTAATIEKKLGLPNNFITNQLAAEQQLLKKVFKVKSLPPAFQYSMDHGMGLSYAASTNDKGIMKQAINTLLGMTNAQNQALGMGGWEKNRIKLLKNVKKDSSLLPELNAHMKLGYGNILPNQETFYKIEGTGRNKKIIPTFEGQNQPDRFKSYVNQISKQTVSDIKQAFPDKTVQKSILDFKKGNTKTLNNLLKKLEARGCKGKAAGGRILFSNGGEAITTCAKKGVQGFIDDLKKGNYSKATKDILKGGGNVIKNIANPMELLKLRNYFGPVALGLMAAYEGGVITDDVIRQGTPLNESLANNWLTRSFLPYTKDYAKAKNLLETGKVPANMKKYVKDVVTFNELLKDQQGIEGRKDSRLIDDTGYGMIDGTSMYTKKQEQKENKDLIKKAETITESVFTPGTAKALEMKALQDENEATRMAKKEFSPFFGFSDLKDRNKTSVFDEYISATEEAPKDFRPVTYKDAEYKDKKLPLGIEQLYMNKYKLKPRDSLSKYSYEDSDKNILEDLTEQYNKFKRQEEASQYPGYFGANEKFMEGGIASLNVKK